MIVEGVVALAAAVGGSAPVSRGWTVFYALVSIAFGVLALGWYVSRFQRFCRFAARETGTLGFAC